MDSKHLANRIANKINGNKRYIIALAGPPAAGKSSLAEELRDTLTKQGVLTKVVPMDGFHLDNNLLTKAGLLDRKGSPQTFDVAGFINLVKRIRTCEKAVYFPVFDRKRDLAIAGAGIVESTDQVIVLEGNYLLIDQEPWKELYAYLDDAIFVNPGIDVLKQRLFDRWINQGLGREEVVKKVQANDLPNAEFVLQYSKISEFETG